jgi:hypothetical protein
LAEHSSQEQARGCILCLIEPTSGEVRFDGQEVTALDKDSLRALARDMQIDANGDRPWHRGPPATFRLTGSSARQAGGNTNHPRALDITAAAQVGLDSSSPARPSMAPSMTAVNSVASTSEMARWAALGFMTGSGVVDR